jgi:hypothetical protein
MDDSPFLRQDETQQFQSFIGAMQWAVLIRRLDITIAVMSLSSFCAMPKGEAILREPSKSMVIYER